MVTTAAQPATFRAAQIPAASRPSGRRSMSRAALSFAKTNPPMPRTPNQESDASQALSSGWRDGSSITGAVAVQISQCW